MKFKTLRTSETGKKFSEVEKKIQEVRKLSRELADEVGSPRYYINYGCAAGGISGFLFDDKIAPPYFRKSKNLGYYPNTKTKEGKQLRKKIDKLPTVRFDELNSIVGWDSIFGCIGFVNHNEEYYLFDVPTEDYTPPSDCEEITVGEYNKIIKR